MTWPFGGTTAVERGQTPLEVMSSRVVTAGSRHGRHVNRDQALRHSAVWACLRLRADLISTMPADTFRRVGGTQVEVTKPPVLVTPGGAQVLWDEWVYSSQVDLDGGGNTFGIIAEVDGAGRPARIDLVPLDECVLRSVKGVRTLKVNGESFDYDTRVWHEKQFTVSGKPVGLSPIAYAAMTISGYLSAQAFVDDWFQNGATPSSVFRNTKRSLKPGESRRVRAMLAESLRNGEPLVTGQDWEYSMLGAKASEAAMLETQDASVTDICRYLGVPGDMIDANTGGGNVTYANVTQRNLQLLVMNVGPAILRREHAWSQRLLAQPRYVKLNRGSLLAMDLAGRLAAHKTAIDARIYPPSRALAMEDMPPLSPDEVAEFGTLFGSKASAPTTAPTAPTTGL